MSRPELPQLINDELGLLFKNPVPALLDHATFPVVGNRLGTVDAMITEGSLTRPCQHGHSELVAAQFFRLLGHLRNTAVVIQAAAKVTRLPHLHDEVLDVFLGECTWIVSKVPEEMTQVLLFTPFYQEPGDIHVHVHAEVPIRDTRIDITGMT